VVDDSGPGFGRIQPGAGIGLRAAGRDAHNCAGRLEFDRGPLGGVRVRLRLPVPEGLAAVSRKTM
jgi:signal transduction histidine kinase